MLICAILYSAIIFVFWHNSFNYCLFHCLHIIHTFITSSLFNVLAALALHLMSTVTLLDHQLSSSQKITDRLFCCASPCLWNQLLLSLRQFRTSFLIPESWRLYFWAYQFFLYWLTTLLSHNFVTLSLPA